MKRKIVAIRLIVLMASLLPLIATSAASAAGPAWRIDSVTNTTAVPGGTIEYGVQISNVGDAATNGDPYTLQVEVPPGLTGVSVDTSRAFSTTWDCNVTASVITCTSTAGDAIEQARREVLPVTAAVDPDASGVLTSTFHISGGGAGSASTVDPTTITPIPPPFGLDAFDGQVTADAAGNAFTQAGGHPYAASTSIDFNTIQNPNPTKGALWPVEPVKDILVDLPPGFVGDPTSVAQCSLQDLSNGGIIARPLCPPASQVGTTLVRVNFGGGSFVRGPFPVFSLVRPADVPARFGFNVLGTIVTLNARVRSGSDYGLSIDAADVPEGLPLAGTTLTFWGTPADPSHDAERGCPNKTLPAEGGPSCAAGTAPKPFLRNPTSCTPPAGSAVSDGLVTEAHIDSWTHPGPFGADPSPELSDPRWQTASLVSHLLPGYPAPSSEWGAHQLPSGCDEVPFDPSSSFRPTGQASAGTPSAFAFDLSLPQSEEPGSIGEADLRTADVTLPPGVRVSPAAADGLQACSIEQIDLHSTAAPACPNAAKLGTVTVKTPLLEEPLAGSIYLATPHQNPFGSLIALYLVAKGHGVTIKLVGEVKADPVTGQLETLFADQPQLPFSDLHLEFSGGPRAPLTLPAACGTYTTHALLTSWSGKTVHSASSFAVDHGPDGGPCVPMGFGPSVAAGTTNPVAGAYAPLSLRLQRSDSDAGLGQLTSLRLPPGLLANVASVPVRCTDAQAAAAACPAASHVGTATVGAGAGPLPFYINGDVYLMGQQSSGPLAGDPFALAIVTHAVAGPFDLGYVTVKAGVQIHDDGSITTVSEPFPSILQGIPLDLRDVRVLLDRPGFTFNPTDCEPLGIDGALSSPEGQTAAFSQRFQALDCASLSFHPRLSASTLHNGTFNKNGASLDVKISTGQDPHNPGAPGEANIHRVEVALPAAMPSRLTTLQKACTEKQFAQNPAGCPREANVGTAVAHSPVLASPLSGPAYLVSHGSQAFPDLVLVLQGEGIILHLTGHTQIKKGITFSRFETVPDAPISSFELKLPEGPFSALAATTPLCGRTVTSNRRVRRRVHGHTRRVLVKSTRLVPAGLVMPTTITGQNGAVLRQSTRIAVTGCAKVKTKVKKRGKAGRAREVGGFSSSWRTQR